MHKRSDLARLSRALGGLPVLGCLAGSPAALAGLRYGDVLLSVDGRPTPDWDAFIEARRTSGERMRIEIFRDGEVLQLELELELPLSGGPRTAADLLARSRRGGRVRRRTWWRSSSRPTRPGSGRRRRAATPRKLGCGMGVSAALAEVCDRVPDVVTVALVLLPDAIVLGAAGQGGMLEHEQLARAAARCFARSWSPDDELVEYFALVADRVVILERGRRERRLALCTVSRRNANVGFLLATAREALAAVEASVDMVELGVD